MRNARRGNVIAFPHITNDAPITDNDATIFDFPSYHVPGPVVA